MKSTNHFTVRFGLRHPKSNQTEASIFVRIIVDKKRSEIYLNKTIDPNFWNNHKQCAQGSRELTARINPHLDEVRFKLNDCYQQLKMQGIFITAKPSKVYMWGKNRYIIRYTP